MSITLSATPATSTQPGPAPAQERRSRLRRLRDPGLVAAVVVIALILIAAIAPGLLTGADPLAADPFTALQAPSGAHWFGTDQLGRDVFTRTVHGARYSLAIGTASTALSLLAGGLVGLLAGLAPRWIDEVLSRALDVLSAFPEVLLALLFIAFTEPGTPSLVLAIALAFAPRYGRIVRAQTLLVRRAGYVEQAVTFGLSRARLVWRHVLPNVLGPLPILATIGLGTAIVNASALSFLGMGPQPPTPEWGAMLSESRSYLRVAWWSAILPGATLTVTVIALTALGRRLQRRFEGRR
ncbi:ABC transporter permease [Dactylosporangium matsuzakiense]|uniref:Peptide ABC transporter permease n=1 Tax=Dactylosporangium matsuzakiense TaxID=53360 RepID=A0A9W6KR20_9ACTN|nr:ABC transporter permease [Dactylosporangium matsuzakiense]UWZ49123.1 ABC transporter permease [Dactylosporangium matsuzakiense]GLL06527.1 peptide ABC transporter permease [Dactylosporangium matsuzakiense]